MIASYLQSQRVVELLQGEEPVAGEAVKKRPKKTTVTDGDDDREESTILTGLDDPSGQYEAQRLPKGNLEQIRPRL